MHLLLDRVSSVRTVAVFGLGEAGSVIASDLAHHVKVQAFDPAPVDTPLGVRRHDSPAAAVVDVDLVLAVTAARDASIALTQALHEIPQRAVFADLSTSTPAVMRELASRADDAGLRFADVALMASVPGRGLRTPQLASGPGARAYASLLQEFDVPVDVLDGDSGQAMTHKLLRSVVVKGLGMLLLESVRAGDAAGLGTWVRDHLTATLEQSDGELGARLVDSMPLHGPRRLEEMRAAAALLEDLHVPATVTRSVIAALRDLVEGAVEPVRFAPPPPPSP